MSSGDPALSIVNVNVNGIIDSSAGSFPVA